MIERDGRLLVTRRLEGTHLSGYWEFPGGKCEPGEAHEACLAREILEELDVTAEVGAKYWSPNTRIRRRTVRLHFRRCRIHGDPKAVLGQEMRWITREELRELQFPEADRELIDLLTEIYFASARSTVTVSPSLTVTLTGAAIFSASCHTFNVYVPAGTPSSLNRPSAPVAALSSSDTSR